MGILDDINNMKNQGMGEKEIITQLQERGVSPKSIQEGLNQMRIKNAVSAESSGEEGMEPSIMKNSQNSEAPQVTSLYAPKTQELGQGSEGFYTPPPSPPQFQSNQFNDESETPSYGENQEEYSPQEGSGEQLAGATSYDTDTLIEIAEQVFSERIKREQKQIGFLNEFATLAETKIGDAHERIKKIEEVMDKLQAAILEKVGSYGKNLDTIKNEMGMMQESFEKMIPSMHERSYKNNGTGNNNNRKGDYEENTEETPEEPQEETTTTSVIRKKTSKTKK